MTTHLTTIFAFFLLAANPTCGDVTKMAGHLKRFGQGRQSATPVKVIEGFPSPFPFMRDHIRPQRPLLMRGAAKFSGAFTQWTDAYLGGHPEARETYVGVEVGKKEDRQGGGFDSTFAEFVDIYQKRDIYLVSRTPVFLRRDILVPCPLQCKKLLKNHVHTVYMWFSSGGTKSVVHNDNLENINCLFRGDKQLVMVDPSKFTIPFDHADEGFSSVDVDSVDYTKYPWAAEVEYQHVNMTAGDCLYIPTNWYHQVNSNGSNLAVNIWVEPEPMQTYDVRDCNQLCDLSLTMDQAKLSTQDKADILESLEDDKVMSPKELVRHISYTNKLDVDAIKQMEVFQQFETLVLQLLKDVAKEEDRVTKDDLTRLSPKDWHQLTTTLETLQLTAGNDLAEEMDQLEAATGSDVTPEELAAHMEAKSAASKEEL